jgi:hypothetical protein
MKGNNAIVITYIGVFPSDNIIKSLAEVLVQSGVTIPEMINITTKDESAIANALLRDVEVMDTNSNDAKTSAIVYIGKRFDDTLAGSNGNHIPFAMALLHGIAEAKRNHTEEGVSLINAVEIIAKMDKVPKIARMYHITNDVIKVIREIYQNTWIGT